MGVGDGFVLTLMSFVAGRRRWLWIDRLADCIGGYRPPRGYEAHNLRVLLEHPCIWQYAVFFLPSLSFLMVNISMLVNSDLIRCDSTCTKGKPFWKETIKGPFVLNGLERSFQPHLHKNVLCPAKQTSHLYSKCLP